MCMHIPLFLCSHFYFLSRVRWQITSMEKLNASANATANHKSPFTIPIMVIPRQKKQAMTVNAFFSEKYFLYRPKSMVSNFFIMTAKVNFRAQIRKHVNIN